MAIDTNSGLFSRETLAGYDPARLSSAVVVIVGLGAAGSNVVQTLALAGVGELRLIDFDSVEPSNLTRSPLFDRRRLAGKKKRYKAREASLGALAFSYAEDPIVRYKIGRFEEVGLAGFVGADVVVAAVDSLGVRALLSDATRRLGIPLVEVGFSATRGQVSVFPNQANNEPCWRCLHPRVEDGVASCTLYAQRVVAEGAIPATQSLAAFLGALTAEHAIQAVHGQFPLGGRVLFQNLHTGRSNILTLTTDPCCPGVHRRLGAIRPLSVSCDEPVRAVIEATRSFAADPIVHLPAAFISAMPCAQCGSPVDIAKPAWAITQPPRCEKCPDLPQLGDGGMVLATTVAGNEPLAQRRCQTVGLSAAAILEIEDGTSGEMHAVQLAGGLDDIFDVLRRRGNTTPPASIEIEETQKSGKESEQ